MKTLLIGLIALIPALSMAADVPNTPDWVKSDELSDSVYTDLVDKEALKLESDATLKQTKKPVKSQSTEKRKITTGDTLSLNTILPTWTINGNIRPIKF